MRRRWLALSSLCSLFVGVQLALAGPGGNNPKLPAPTNVVCLVALGQVDVSWDLVPDANAYQVQHVGLLTDGPIVEGSEFVLAPPVTFDLLNLDLLAVRVRALPAPKHEGQPIQAGAPKGQWSLPCLVEIPVINPLNP
jgi:hypothetical protein